jgi:predicted RNA-binding protein with PIN domain
MSLHVIIDGYNLIRQSHVFSVLDRQNLQHAREALVDTLAAYRRIRHHKITVVFDGSNAHSEIPSRDSRKGIQIKFSSGGEPADNVIKRMATRERERALVVSSDRDIVDFASSQGSATISSPQFEEKITVAACNKIQSDDTEDTPGWIPTTKKKGPGKRSSKRERRNRTKIKKL